MCLFSGEKHVSSQMKTLSVGVFYAMFHLVSKIIRLTKMVVMHRLLTA